MLLPLLAQSLGLSYALVGLAKATHSAAMSLLEIPAGLLSEYVGEWRLLVFGLLCAGTGYASLSISGSYYEVLGALFLSGCGAAFQHSLSSSLISQAYDDNTRRVALGTYNSSGDIGKLISTGLLSVLLGAGVGWQQVAIGYGGTVLCAGLTLLLVLILDRRLRRRASPVAQGTSTFSPHVGSLFRDKRGFVVLATIVLLDTAVQDGFLIFVAFLMLQKQVPTGLAALAVVLTLVGGVAGKFACGVLAQRLGVVRSLVLVECLTAIGIVAVYVLPAMPAFCLLPFLGVVLQGSSSITYGTVDDLVVPGRRARGFAIIYSLAGIASVAGPLTLGLLADSTGLGAVVYGLAVLVLLPAALGACLVPALRPASSA